MIGHLAGIRQQQNLILDALRDLHVMHCFPRLILKDGELAEVQYHWRDEAAEKLYAEIKETLRHITQTIEQYERAKNANNRPVS